MKNLLIIGARGFGREVYNAFLRTESYMNKEICVKGFLDDKEDAFDGISDDLPPIIGSVENYIINPDDVFICALGDSTWRKHYVEIISKKGGRFINIIHPSAYVSPQAKIGVGCFISSFTSVSPNSTIGNHVMIQAYDTISHDTIIGDYASIESYVFLGGYSKVGEMTTMHTKSSIIPHKSVGKSCVVGFGSVVMRSFKDEVHVFGNPARVLKLE